MRRLLSGILALVLSASCTPVNMTDLQRDLTLAAEQQLKRVIVAQFSRRLVTGVELAIAGLAHPGGYLDNPLVRILLPPPMGMVLGVVQDLREDPQAVLLETLMNRAAEAAVPGAGPILAAVVESLTTGEVEDLLTGGRAAATDFIAKRARGAVSEALGPVIAESLADSGADEVYARMLRLYDLQRSIDTAGEKLLQDALAEAVPEPLQEPLLEPLPESSDSIGDIVVRHAPRIDLPITLMPEALEQAPTRDLTGYVTGKAVDGVFRALAQQEERIRGELDRLGLQPVSG